MTPGQPENLTSDVRTEATVQALADFGKNLTQGLFQNLAEACFPLERERDDAAKEAATLRNSHAALLPRVQAKIRILNIQIDEATAASDDEQAAAKKAEAKTLQDGLADTLVRAAAAEKRQHAASQELQQLTRRIFEKSFPEIRASLITVERSFCQMLDDVERGLDQYAETGVQIPFSRLDLTPSDVGPEGTLFYRLRGWFGGRR
jgi:hypothetical protein